MTNAFVVALGLAIGLAWGVYFTQPPAPLGPLPPECHTAGVYTKQLTPIRFCAPPEVGTN